MSSDKLNSWVQVCATIALIIGLGLVVYELQQTRDAIKSQLTSDGFQLMGQFYTSAFGEEPQDVLAKACDSPTELTTSDLVVLDNFYTQLVHRSLRIIKLEERGGYYERAWIEAPSIERDATGGWGLLFSTAPGRAFWRSYKGDAALKEYGDRMLANWRGLTCDIHHEEWRALIDEELDR